MKVNPQIKVEVPGLQPLAEKVSRWLDGAAMAVWQQGFEFGLLVGFIAGLLAAMLVANLRKS